MKKQILIAFISIFTINWCVNAQTGTPATEKFTLVMHGGAGTIRKENMSEEKEKAYKDKIKEALEAGYDILKNGGTSVDAVEASIKHLEDSPLFNAGKGSVFTYEGKNEMDASIMDGKTLNAGAVAAISTVKNPISAALLVMRKSPHVLLAGEGATQFARENNLEIVDSSYFFDERRWNYWQKIKDSEKEKKDSSDDRGEVIPKQFDNEFNKETDSKYGTVGAVAVDRYGNLAAGTSTGGMTNKMYGRVGDSPIIGAGTYANNKTCAVSCTGHGEYFMRSVVAYDITAMVEYKGMTVKEAAEEVVNRKLPELGGAGGVIVLDANGNFAMPFNTDGMYRGYVKEDGKVVVFLYKD